MSCRVVSCRENSMARQNYFFVLLLLILIFLESSLCLNASFKRNHETIRKHISKRDIFQNLEKASYSFNGFRKVGAVPVIFPLDICLMDIKNETYAAALHINKNGVQYFSVFRNTSGHYQLIAGISAPLAITIDCGSFGEKGYVAIAHNITAPIRKQTEGSTIYEISGSSIRAIQYFAASNITDILFLLTLDGLYMLQTLKNTASLPNLDCPYFRFEGGAFQPLGNIPCTNAQHLETFAIDDEIYVAVPNYCDRYGRTEIDSEVYKYDREKRTFKLFQRIPTNGAVHVKYFKVPSSDDYIHFLIFGNSISSNSSTSDNSEKGQEVAQKLEADSIIFRFKKGQFVPHQRLTFYDVDQFLPIENLVAEKFLLLVGCRNQDVKIFTLTDWSFKESTTQYTGGAFGNKYGVINMRVHTSHGNSYLVVANRNMLSNNTNIFLPIFQQDKEASLLRNEIIEWSKANAQRLAKVDVHELQREVERKLASYPQKLKSANITEISEAYIKNVTTKSLVYPHLRIGNGYWKALSYAKRALDVLERKLKQGSQLRDKRDLEKSSKSGTPDVNEFNFDRLHGRTLIVRNKVKARKINGFNVSLGEFEHITAQKVVVSGKYEDERSTLQTTEGMKNNAAINVNNLQIIGKLNGFTWDDLVHKTLKRRGSIQFLKAPSTLANVAADAVTVTSNEVGSRDVAKLISTDSGSFVVNQNVIFNKTVNAKNVIIHERLNNIHVHNDRLDVLLRSSNETQVVHGLKHFDGLTVKAPIKFVDRQMSGMTIPDSLTLNGHYTIDGDVTVLEQLTADDIIDGPTKLSAKAALSNGIRMDEPLDNINMKFDHPIIANSSMVSFINTCDLQHLIRTNTDDVQVVEGEKVFTESLEIRAGFAEVKLLNGIDVEDFEKRLFLRDANQTFTVPMHFGNLITQRVESPQLTLNSSNLKDYLSLYGTQRIHGTLHVDNLTTKWLTVQDLHTHGKIFNKPLAEIYQQKVKSSPHPNIFQKGRKFRGSIYVRNLKLNSTINGVGVDQLKRQMGLLSGDIRYVGNLKFDHEMEISNLSFKGKLNGIPAAEFGKRWLQRYGDQCFTAAQTISRLDAESCVLLQRTLNGYKVEDFITETYGINRDEFIASAIFEKPIQVQGALYSNTVNNIFIPQDILYRSSAQPQILSFPFTVKGNLLVHGHIHNTTTFNGLNFLDLERYMQGYGWDTLYVQNGTFTSPPQYKTLNQHNLQQTLENVWLANENVHLREHMEISNGHFEGLIELEGPINNVNLKYLKENYFSLTRPQTIYGDMIFSNVIKFAKDLYANNIQLNGQIIDSKSKSSLSFDDFVSNTLKISGPHTISGHWSIPEVKVFGDLNNVLINRLNLATDVVHNNVQFCKVTATKRIAIVNIKKLYITPNTLVNKVNIVDWIKDAVFVYENHTIRGTTVLDTVNMYNDLQVDGSVNNIVFDEHTLLLRERQQVLRGPVLIRNKFPTEQRILTNNIENLLTETVNGWSVSEFYASKAKLGPDADVRGSLVFVNPLHVSEFRPIDGTRYDNVQRPKRSPIVTALDYKSTASLSDLESATETLRVSFSSYYYVLEDFEIRQILRVNAEQIVSLPIRLNGELIDVVSVVLDSSKKPQQYFNWNATLQQFVLNQNLSWISEDQRQLNILKSERDGDVFPIYPSGNDKMSPYCLSNSQNITSNATTVRVKQILPLPSEHMIAVLCTDVVEIWNTSSTPLQPVQHLAVTTPKRITVVSKDEAVIYLALLSESKENSFYYGAVEVYRSINNSQYIHLQTIECIRPLQIEFAVIRRSNDLLLYILSDSYVQPLTIYQYKGVAGWARIVGVSILPKAFEIKAIHLRATKQDFIALVTKKHITFVEVVVKKV